MKFIDGLTNLADLRRIGFLASADLVIFESERSFPPSIMIKMSPSWTLSTLHFGSARPA